MVFCWIFIILLVYIDVGGIIGSEKPVKKIAYSIYDSQMMQTMIDEGRGLMMGRPGFDTPEGAPRKKIKMPMGIKRFTNALKLRTSFHFLI